MIIHGDKTTVSFVKHGPHDRLSTSAERKALDSICFRGIASHEHNVRATSDMRLGSVRVDEKSCLAILLAGPEDGLAKVVSVDPDLARGRLDIAPALFRFRKVGRRVVGVCVDGEASVCADE